MTEQEVLLSFELLMKQYVEELDGVSFEQLLRKPSEDEWSLGQMYLHLIQTSMNSQLRKAELCLQATEVSVGAGEKTEAGREAFEQGGFPPVRIHVPPSPGFTPLQPESKEQLVQGMQAVLQRMTDIAPRIALSGPEHTEAHPRFGQLNAGEWFRLVEMHYRHHLMQKDRLQKFLVSG
ncbi:DinB family protein [Paenibacillus oryzisoli]|uniref:DinB family protein n=1 Tax=Paenibacillus oryzisoli TaxID=1850517 RepID=UPI003D2C05EC